MEIIDCCCGLGRWRSPDKLLPHDPEDTLELMDHFGIAQALVYSNFGSWNGALPESNQMLVETVAKSDRFIPAFVLTPLPYRWQAQADDFADQMRQAGAKAVWMWPQSDRHGHGLSLWRVAELLDLCVRHRLPLLLWAEGIEPDAIHAACSEFPDLRVILAGVGYSGDAWLYPLLRRHECLHVSLGHFYIPPGGVETFLAHFPAERMIFGSGLPQFSPGGLIGHVLYAQTDDATKEKILGGNLKRLLSEVQL